MKYGLCLFLLMGASLQADEKILMRFKIDPKTGEVVLGQKDSKTGNPCIVVNEGMKSARVYDLQQMQRAASFLQHLVAYHLPRKSTHGENDLYGSLDLAFWAGRASMEPPVFLENFTKEILTVVTKFVVYGIIRNCQDHQEISKIVDPLIVADAGVNAVLYALDAYRSGSILPIYNVSLNEQSGETQ